MLRIRRRSRVIGFVARLCFTNVIGEFVTAEVVCVSRIALGSIYGIPCSPFLNHVAVNLRLACLQVGRP